MNKGHAVFKWLHLSDIHFSTAGFNAGRLRSSLLSYLKGLGEQFDCMVLSGDYRYAPEKKSDTEEVAAYINKLLDNTSLSNDRIVLIPGNHDLKRSRARKALTADALNDYDPTNGEIDSSILDILVSDDTFKFFNDLKASITKRNKVISIKGNPHSIFDMGKCYLLALNTTIIANGGASDKHKLIIGSDYVLKLIDMIRDSPKPIISVGHHAIDWLSQEEQKVLLPLFKKNGVNLYLCGHSLSFGSEKIVDGVAQVSVGCMRHGNNDVEAVFSVGKVHEDGTVSIGFHKWNALNHKWMEFPLSAKNKVRTYRRLYKIPKKEEGPIKTKNAFTIAKVYPIPPRGYDGIKYIWEKGGHYVESASFNKRLKECKKPDDEDTSAYTISTSIGCLLSTMNCQCKFCETGRKDFVMPLTADDIALQCIFGALYDMNCKNHPKVHKHKREFAFMGQGEPGLNYDAVKKAIMLTDIAMGKLKQKVSRYIISTCGISDFLSSLILDTNNKVFKNKVSVHFSLHVHGEERDKLMPINKYYNYREFIHLCEILYVKTHNKIGVGLLLFNNYETMDSSASYDLTQNNLKKILEELDRDVFRIDLCTLNQTNVGHQNQMSEEIAEKLEKFVKSEGFECKLFSSFGDNNNSGCGMFSSKIDGAEDPGDSTIRAFNEAVNLLREAKKEYEETLLSDNEETLRPDNKENTRPDNKEEGNTFSDYF